MHSHDRTLLASLGFSDPDKQEQGHELACMYLARPTVATRVLAALFPAGKRTTIKNKNKNLICFPVGHEGIPTVEYTSTRENPMFCQAKFEQHIHKGEGKYSTTIGFLDLMIYGESKTCIGFKDGTETSETYDNPCGVLVEVKYIKVPTSSVIRQINLYRQYCNNRESRWLLVTAYEVSAAEIEMLKNEGIAHMILGDQFYEWVEAGCPSDGPSQPQSI